MPILPLVHRPCPLSLQCQCAWAARMLCCGRARMGRQVHTAPMERNGRWAAGKRSAGVREGGKGGKRGREQCIRMCLFFGKQMRIRFWKPPFTARHQTLVGSSAYRLLPFIWGAEEYIGNFPVLPKWGVLVRQKFCSITGKSEDETKEDAHETPCCMFLARSKMPSMWKNQQKNQHEGSELYCIWENRRKEILQ